MFTTIIGASVGLALLYFGGEWLVRGASALASRLGVAPVAIGLTVVAFGTSAPELVVSLQAAHSGANDISVGNVVGSNIANIALILGLVALVRPVLAEARIVRIDLPIMIVSSFAMMAILADDQARRFEGGLLVLALVAYTTFTFLDAAQEPENIQDEFATAAPEGPNALGSSLLLVGGGLACLIFGGHLLVAGAVELAIQLGISQAVIGLTLVAIGTSLPELATSLVAARHSQGDIAIGGIIGSNIFNILSILGLTSLIQPLVRGAISWIDLSLMTALACGLSGLVYFRPRLGRIEGACLLGVYTAYTSWQLIA